jgi:hypothetical protein
MKTNKIISNILLSASLIVIPLFTSCSDNDEKMLSDADITSFKVNMGNGVYKVGHIDGTTITFKITPDFDLSKLKALTSSFYISLRATVSPLPSDTLDFSNGAVYTVTAQDGTKKDWTVKWTYGDKVADGDGFEYNYKLWDKTWDELGLGGENSCAVCGKYLVLSRSCICLDKLTGEDTGVKLNTTGIPSVDGSSAKAVPFYLTNDTEGNMIGVTLRGWSGAFNIYKWTSVDSAPVLLFSDSNYGFSRKVTVVGNVNSNAYIYDMGQGFESGAYFRLKVTNGSMADVGNMLDEKNLFRTHVSTADGSWLQIFTPFDDSANPTGYVIDSADDGCNVWYYKNGTSTAITGPVTNWYYSGSYCWGNYQQVAGKAFTFNGKLYGSILTSSWEQSYLNILEPNNSNNVFMSDTMPTGTYNGNATGCVATGLSDDGESLYVYELVTANRIRCHVLTKYKN